MDAKGRVISAHRERSETHYKNVNIAMGFGCRL